MTRSHNVVQMQAAKRVISRRSSKEQEAGSKNYAEED